MPQIGNQKFPYTPSGIRRANAIKKKLAAAMRPQGNNVRRAEAPSGNLRREATVTNQRRQAPTAIDPSVGKGSDSVFNPPRMPERTPPSFGRPKPITFPGRFPGQRYPSRPTLTGNRRLPKRRLPRGVKPPRLIPGRGLEKFLPKPPARPGMGNQRRPKPPNRKRFM
jgi:hypothetical protein